MTNFRFLEITEPITSNYSPKPPLKVELITTPKAYGLSNEQRLQDIIETLKLKNSDSKSSTPKVNVKRTTPAPIPTLLYPESTLYYENIPKKPKSTPKPHLKKPKPTPKPKPTLPSLGKIPTAAVTFEPEPVRYPKVPKTMKMFVPLFKPVWTFYKIMEKLADDFKSGNVRRYLDVY